MSNYANKIITKAKKHLAHNWPVLLIVLLILASSYRMLPFFGAVMHNDFNYLWNAVTNPNDYLSVWTSNYLGNDLSSTVFLLQPKTLIVGLLVILFKSHYLVSYLVSYGLMFLCSLTYYYIFSKISRSRAYGLLAATFVVLNNFTIENIVFGGYYFYFPSLIALALLINILVHVCRRDNSLLGAKEAWKIILISVLITHPFYLIAYLILLFCYAVYMYFFVVKARVDQLKKYLAILGGIVGVHFYWILPFFGSSVTNNPQLVYSGNAKEAVFNGFYQAASAVGSLNFFEYFNLVSQNMHQTIWHYLFYALIPVMMLVFLYKAELNRKTKRMLIWLALMFILFYNLGLGPKSGLIGTLWLWFWRNISSFSFFRSFSRMLIVIIPIYLFFFAFVKRYYLSKYSTWIASAVIGVILVLNAVFFTGDLKGSIRAIDVPAEYKALDGYLQGGDPQHNVVLALPPSSFELYEWAVNDNRELMPQGFSIKNYLLSNPILTVRSGLNYQNQNESLSNLFNYPPDTNIFNESLDGWNIGYILIEKKIVDQSFVYRTDTEIYEEHLRSYPELFSLITSNEQYDLYSYLKPGNLVDVSSGAINLDAVSPIKYRLIITGLNKDAVLNFNQARHVGWTLLPGSFKDCRGDNKCNNGAINLSDLRYLFTNPVWVQNEPKNYLTNAWDIDYDTIRDRLPSSSYRVNPDGSYDIAITLYFKPQLTFIIGIIVTLGVLMTAIYLNKKVSK